MTCRTLAALVPFILLAAGCSSSSSGEECLGSSIRCGGTCVEPKNDNLNCGLCGTVCVAGKVCSAGACVETCAAGTTTCPGSGIPYCADTTRDSNNCGECGRVCEAGTSCSGGACVTSCPAGEYACDGSCVDPDSDPDYCGAASDCRGGTACGALQACYQGACADVCGWEEVWQAPLDSLPAGGSARTGTLAAGWSFSLIGGRTAFTSGSDWMELSVPADLAVGDDAFAAQADFYANPVTLASGSFRNIGLYLLSDLHDSGQDHGFWAGFREEGGLATQFEWVTGPASLPATGWDAWDLDRGLGVVAQSAPLALPVGGWHTLRVEGIRSLCWFQALVDGAVVSTWRPASCDLAGGSVAVASARVFPIGVAYSNLAVHKGWGAATVCVP